MIIVFTLMNILNFYYDNIIKDKFSKLFFRKVCMKPVVFRMNLYQEVALSFKKVGDP